MPKYGKFRIGDLFVPQCGDFDIQQNHINGKGLFVVSSGETNLGIIGKSDIEAKVFSAGTITIDMFGYAYYRGHDYKMVTHARVFSLSLKNENITRETGMYFAAQFGFFKNIFSYNNMANWKKIKDIEIKLPITADGKIDFAYIENYIREMEAACIRELEAYLKTTGLSNYKLTNNELQFMQTAKTVKYNGFRIGKLFDISTPKKKFNANTLSFGGKYRYVARGESNNGIRGYIDEDECYLNSANTISFGQDTATMFFQNAPYFTGDKIKIFTLLESSLTCEIAVYLITVMKKAFVNFGWGRSSFNVNVLKEVKISLPVTTDGNPDYDYMTRFIRIQQKLAIKNVAEWKDRELETYRAVTAK